LFPIILLAQHAHFAQVTREPVRTRAVDQVVQKTVLQTSEEEKASYQKLLDVTLW
jgi:hypothetical protein